MPDTEETAQRQVTVVYLGGFGRSGSTLVERMLGAAPGWVNVGELVDLARSVAPADELCGCGAPFSSCPFWTRVGERAFGGWTEDVLARLAGLQRAAARQRHLPGLLSPRHVPSEALTALRDSYARIYAAVAEVAGASVVVDASKGPALGQALAGAPGIDLRMLNIVRDPRAVAWSWSRRVARPHVTAVDQEMWRISARRAAAQWGALQLEVEVMARRGGARSARLRYEDFVADPLGSLITATTALGLPLGPGDLPAIVDGAVGLGPSHGLSGNPGRFRSGTVQLRRDDRWATAMPIGDRAVVTALTLPLLKAYRYPTAPALGTARPRHRTERHEMRTSA
jgi:hypothetical protein